MIENIEALAQGESGDVFGSCGVKFMNGGSCCGLSKEFVHDLLKQGNISNWCCESCSFASYCNRM